MKKFTLSLKNGKTEQANYTPLIYIRGTGIHHLALHKVLGIWKISQVETGYLIANVQATYKGCPVNSKGFKLGQARSLALATLDNLVDRVGIEQFEKVLTDKRGF